MILPFEPHSISFDDITYAVDMPKVISEEEVFNYTLFFTLISPILSTEHSGNEESRCD